ncbi:MAG: SH3 domain-containing protein [Anaerolineae bacterium]|jgi:uncharacterized protein YgiM (DUF1202 family)|nr:SH3 domain-containing protein [Anaerolineae bacterium]
MIKTQDQEVNLMLRRILTLALLLFGIGSAPVATIAQACTPNLPQYIVRALRACRDLERNTACYGNGTVVPLLFEAAALAGDQPFEASGDQISIDALQAITTGQTPLTADSWGIATLTVQANLLEEQPRRVSQLWIMGDTRVTNLVPPLPEVRLTSDGTLNLRSAPQTDADILEQIPLRGSVLANGRTQDGRWLRVFVPRTDTLAWASVDVVTPNGDVNALAVVDVNTPFYRPYQIISLTTGRSDSPCADVPDSGLLLQTPNDFDEVMFIVNEAILRVTGTVFLQTEADPRALIVNVLNGLVTIEANAQSERVPAGARAIVPIGGASSAPEAYTLDDLEALPLDGLFFTFEIPAPLTPDEILAALNPVIVPTPTYTDPLTFRRCVRRANRVANLRGGPADFYEVIGEVREGDALTIVFQNRDASGSLWWQLRGSGWILADYVTSEGDCDDVPNTTATIANAGYNILNLERCQSDNGPIRAGQNVEMWFLDGSFETRAEAIESIRVAPGFIEVGTTSLYVYPSQPIRVTEDRWYIRYTAYWRAVPGTFDVEGRRRSYEVRCELTVPFGRIEP